MPTAREAIKMLHEQIAELETELTELRALNAALVSQSAGGVRVTKIAYQFETISLLDGQRKVIFEIAIPPGGKLHSWEVKNDLIHLAWQRPARGSEGKE